MVVSRASQVRRAARIFVGPGYGGPHRSSFFGDRVNDSDLHVVISCGRIFTTGPGRDHGSSAVHRGASSGRKCTQESRCDACGRLIAPECIFPTRTPTPTRTPHTHTHPHTRP